MISRTVFISLFLACHCRNHAKYVERLSTGNQVAKKVRTSQTLMDIREAQMLECHHKYWYNSQRCKVVTSSGEKKNTFNEQTVLVFSTPSGQYQNRLDTLVATSDINVTRADVLKQLTTLSFHRAAGPHEECQMLLSGMAEAPPNPLLILFQTSLEKVTVPDIWKRANICPII